MKNKKRYLFSLVFFLNFLAASQIAKADDIVDFINIVENNQKKASIVLQSDATSQLKEAVGEMRFLINRSSGAELDLVEGVFWSQNDFNKDGKVNILDYSLFIENFGSTDCSNSCDVDADCKVGLFDYNIFLQNFGKNEFSENKISIHVGNTALVKKKGISVDGIDKDGFVIKFPDKKTIFILGPSQWGTEFGVYDFLERYLGVRWLMPGGDGTYYPQKSSINIPIAEVQDEPAFFSRQYSGFGVSAQSIWARRNRIHSRINFHHNLYRLFPETDKTENPLFFPIINGERYFPSSENYRANWQPCFSAPGIVDTAASRIKNYFDNNPGEESYSLGVNDGGGYCQCSVCRSLDPVRKNVVNRDHLTDRYLTWANAVAEKVLAYHPDKKFGFLAYSEIYEPPDRVSVHPRLFPFLTYDRMQWIVPESQQSNKEITQRWGAVSEGMGWYDYIYGSSYLVPRVYPRLMKQYYRFAHEEGVRALYAEAYPNFGEGPKLYVSAKLQWNPYQDVEKLLGEWYDLAVGKEASPYLRLYYDHWEDFWTRRILGSDWYLNDGRQYLPFNNPSYVEDITADEINQSRSWLESAVSKAETQEQKARAGLLLKAFEYYEASVLAYPRMRSLVRFENQSGALGYVDNMFERFSLADKRRYLAKEEFLRHPFLHHGMDIDRYEKLSGLDWKEKIADDIWNVFDWIFVSDSSSNKLEDRLEEIVSDEGVSLGLKLNAKTILALFRSALNYLNKNISFEEGSGQNATDYVFWKKDGVGSVYRSTEATRSGSYGVVVQGVTQGGAYQNFDFSPGKYCLLVDIYVPGGQASGGTVEITLRTLNDQNQNLAASGTKIFRPEPGLWHSGSVCMDANVSLENPFRIRAGAWGRDLPSGKKVYFDNFRLIKVLDQ